MLNFNCKVLLEVTRAWNVNAEIFARLRTRALMGSKWFEFGLVLF